MSASRVPISIDRPIQREQYQDHQQDYNDTSDREQRYSGDIARLNGHELVAIDEWLPGTEPTPYEIDLTDGCEYRTRYWRCRNCGQEQNHRSEFIDHCETPDPPTPHEAFLRSKLKGVSAMTHDHIVVISDSGEHRTENVSGRSMSERSIPYTDELLAKV